MPKTKLYIGTGLVAVAGGLITVAAVSSCDTECTLEARPSIAVEIGYMNGSAWVPLSAEKVWYERAPEPSEADGIDGIAPPSVPQQGICVNEDCSVWNVGYEDEGDFRIFATVCGETLEARAVVKMGADGCHVETETLRLEPSNPIDCDEKDVAPPSNTACSMEARPSVLATIVDEGHTYPVPAQEVTYLTDEHSVPQVAQCANEDCSAWTVGYEVAGNFTISASACGDTGSAEVKVGMTEDGCHVETEAITIEVDGDRCKKDLDIQKPNACDGILYPSTFVYVAEDGGDFWKPIGAQEVTFVHLDGEDERPEHAKCLDEPTCSNWVAGWGLTGDLEITAKVCGETRTQRVNVPISEDGCRPVTEYVPLLWDHEPTCDIDMHDPKIEPPPPPHTPKK